MRVLIIGGTSNIGYLLSKNLSLKNHEVYIGVHKYNQINVLKERIKHDNLNIKICKLNVLNKQDRNLVKKINPDCLVIHDSVGYGGSILEMDINILRKNYEVNIFSNFLLIKKFYELKKDNNSKSKIFITSSISAYLALPFIGCYSSSKAAISNLCKCLKYELKYLNPNISITVIESGGYYTGFNQVMIDNKDKYIYKNSKTYKDINNINRIQRNIFSLIEKRDYTDLVKKIIKEIEKDKPRFRIRKPLVQIIFLKLYLLIFG